MVKALACYAGDPCSTLPSVLNTLMTLHAVQTIPGEIPMISISVCHSKNLLYRNDIFFDLKMHSRV